MPIEKIGKGEKLAEEILIIRIVEHALAAVLGCPRNVSAITVAVFAVELSPGAMEISTIPASPSFDDLPESGAGLEFGWWGKGCRGARAFEDAPEVGDHGRKCSDEFLDHPLEAIKPGIGNLSRNLVILTRLDETYLPEFGHHPNRRRLRKDCRTPFLNSFRV
jgi:hypothetical protein